MFGSAGWINAFRSHLHPHRQDSHDPTQPKAKSTTTQTQMNGCRSSFPCWFFGFRSRSWWICSFVLVFKTRLAPRDGGTRWTFFFSRCSFCLLLLLLLKIPHHLFVSSLEICAGCLFRFTNQPTIGGLSPPACLPSSVLRPCSILCGKSLQLFFLLLLPSSPPLSIGFCSSSSPFHHPPI